MKIITNFIFTILVLNMSPGILSADNFNLILHIGPIKKNIYTISSEYIEKNNKYIINFNLSSKNGVADFIVEKTNGIGSSNGEKLEKKYIPISYKYIESKEDLKKEYYIKFNKDKPAEGKRIPDYDKNKLTPIDKSMLKEIIDPATAFHILSNYADLNQCNMTLKVYDAKRRFNLIISDLEKKDAQIKCKIRSKKIGGYKKKERLNPLELPYEMIIKFDYNDGGYEMISIKGKNKYLTLSLERS